MLRAARVFVEYEPQTRVEGDLQHLDELSRALERIRLVRGMSSFEASIPLETYRVA